YASEFRCRSDGGFAIKPPDLPLCSATARRCATGLAYWNPPEEMIVRQPYLPRFMAGGETNPLGARALYLGKTVYRVHGTNQPSTIGTFVSSGCIRLTNEDIVDLYSRVSGPFVRPRWRPARVPSRRRRSRLMPPSSPGCLAEISPKADIV